MQAIRRQSEQTSRSIPVNGKRPDPDKHVLIVDDDQAMLGLLKLSFEELGSDYQIAVAVNGVDAINKLEQQRFDLLVTDYMMPTLTGIDLARAVRHISPDTQIVLMTAFGSKRLRETTKCLDFDGYLNKPFSMEEIRAVVKHVATRVSDKKASPPINARFVDHLVEPYLRTLQANANARCVILTGPNGHPLLTIGQVDSLKVSNLSAFVASNFLATTELADMPGNRSVFKSSYHEGEDYNIYAHDVNGDLLIAVVFDTKHKPGIVWFYTKQTAAKLAKLLY